MLELCTVYLNNLSCIVGQYAVNIKHLQYRLEKVCEPVGL